jgi:two-component system heavy metal sensor histidine kinase CusS
MSSISATTEHGGASPSQSVVQRAMSRLRQSMATQIALAIALVTALLVVASCAMVGRLMAEEFDAIHPPAAAQLPATAPQAQGTAPGLAQQQARQWMEARQAFVRRAWRILFLTLSTGAAIAGLFTWWITRRILASARDLGDTADRISAQALHERLVPGHSPTELQPVAQAFNRMLDRLQDAFDRLSAFSSDLAHDLRAPIHHLQTAAQVTLSRERSADEYRAVLASAVDDYERIGRLIENILFLARADHAQTRIQPAWVPLAPRMEQWVDYFSLLAQESGLQLILDAAPRPGAAQPALVWADDTLLGRAVGNLLTNALRHARPGSTIVLSARHTPQGHARIEVANEGAPIAPQHQARIFQRRYRVEDPNAPAEPGSGLGLAIVQSIMLLHGGRASVRSAPGRPTVFALEFPTPQPPAGDVRPARPRSAR